MGGEKGNGRNDEDETGVGDRLGSGNPASSLHGNGDWGRVGSMEERQQETGGEKLKRRRNGPWREAFPPLAAGCLAAGLYATGMACIPRNKDSCIEEGLLTFVLLGVLGLAVLPWGVLAAFRGSGSGRRRLAAAVFVLAMCAGLAFGVSCTTFRFRYPASCTGAVCP